MRLHYHPSTSLENSFHDLPPRPHFSWNHVDNSSNGLVANFSFNLQLIWDFDLRLNYVSTDIFFEIAQPNKGFYLILQLNTFFNVMHVVMMELIVLILVVCNWWSFYWIRPLKIFFYLDLHKNLSSGCRKRGVTIIPVD